MIIQCESCQAKFKLDDSRVTEKGVKVKCAKCKNIFVVKKEVPADMPADIPPSAIEEKVSDIGEPSPPDKKPEAQTEVGEDYAFDASEGSLGLEGEGEETESFDIGGEEEAESFDTESFGMGEGEETESFDTESFGMGEEEETESFDMGGEEETGVFEEAQEDTGEAAIDFGEFALEGDNGLEEKEEAPREEITLELAEKEPEDGGEAEVSEAESQLPDEEIPDLAEVTKKAGPRRSNKFLVPLLLLLIFAGGGTYFFTDLQSIINTVKEKLGAKEEGVISIKSLNSYYLQTDKEGPIFIIEAEAQNEDQGARSFIKLKGNLYDDKGKVVMEQVAYAGNVFSGNKLLEMSRAEVRKEMAYKVGKGLSNSNIMPGNKVAFMLVFYDVPSTLSEFDVEVLSSEDVTK
ncbi:MAG: zinc-ribbon domain-containing protein [Proteobacteria bacterium]|nr:zinc-ribbon domain-containing protein [Pseudomonadota bacterium]